MHTSLSLSLDNYSKLFCYPRSSHIGVLQPPSTRLRLARDKSLLEFTTCLVISKLVLSETERSTVEPKDLGCSAFARRYLRNHNCFLFLRLLRCFSLPGLPPPKSEGPSYYYEVGCPIRKPPDQRLLAASPTLWLAATSFFVPTNLGIRCLHY